MEAEHRSAKLKPGFTLLHLGTGYIQIAKSEEINLSWLTKGKLKSLTFGGQQKVTRITKLNYCMRRRGDYGSYFYREWKVVPEEKLSRLKEAQVKVDAAIEEFAKAKRELYDEIAPLSIRQLQEIAIGDLT